MNKKNIADIHKLSPIQTALLFSHTINPEAGLSFQQVAHLHQELDHAHYAQAWQQLVDRHTILRCAYFWDDLSEPLQVVMRQVTLPLQQLDWSDKAEDAWRADLDDLLLSERQNLFNLNEAPLLRLVMIQLAEQRSVVIINFHHINIDGWSLQVLLGELRTIYAALQDGHTPRLPVTRPFRDYINWLGQQDMQATADYWQAAIDGFDTPTRIPLAERSDGIFSGFGEHEIGSFTLPPALVEKIDATVQHKRISFSTLMQAAWSLLLARYNDSKDVVCGMIVHGRPTEFANFERMVGMFINGMPMRIAVQDDMPIDDWLEAVQQQLRAIEQHSFFPVPEIHKMSSLPRSQPLFETLVVDQIMRGVPDDENSAEAIFTYEKNSLLLTLYLRDRNLIWIDYDTAVLAEAQVAQLAERLFFVLDQLVSGSGQSGTHNVGSVTLMPESELKSELPASDISDVMDAFAMQVKAHAAKVALRFESTDLSYAELDARSNQLAHWLQQQGIGRESRVGIYMARSAEMVIAMLGVLKANAAYVPLSLTDPAERVRFISEDAELSLMLTRLDQQIDLAELTTPTCAIDNNATIAAMPTAAPEAVPEPSQLAYSIYTSGSTGQPKGVLIERRSLSALTQAAAERFTISSSDTVLQFATIAFDTSVEEIFSALTSGATLVIRTPEMLDSIALFCQALADNQITTLEMVTAYWHVLADELHSGRVSLPATLRQIVIGGEAVSAEKVRQWHALELGVDLVNSYGPTETTITATSTRLDPNTPDIIPIGTVWPTLTAYVLDSDLRPQPDGVPGELCFSGVGLARGYQNRPKETAKQFVPHPFIEGKRLYRSGDRVVRHENGQIDFLGRVDMQVKVRGFRVELGAIEAQLREHPDVQNAVVVQQQATGQLVAYIQGATSDQLGLWLSRYLPQYMIPAGFITLEQFPINSRGKIDRKQLAAEVFQPVQKDEEEFVAPETEIEISLCAIWCKLLKIEQVGIFDDFFMLGGHSLLATQLVQRVNNAYAVNITIRDVFDQPSVAEIALLVEEQLLDQLEMA